MASPHRIVLTFDNGPAPGVTERVLDALAARHILATFFVIGRKLAEPGGRSLAARARAEGHRVGNHTFFHSIPLGEAPAEAAAAEIGRTQELLGELAPEKYFRPFGREGALGPHLLSPAARDLLVTGRYTCVLWNAVPRDWKEPAAWPAMALAQIEAHRGAGTPTVLVLHDLPTGAMDRLPRFLDLLGERGVAFVQDFPDETVIIREGRVTPACGRYVAAMPPSLS